MNRIKLILIYMFLNQLQQKIKNNKINNLILIKMFLNKKILINLEIIIKINIKISQKFIIPMNNW
jgi:hypothetical protein